MISVVLIGTGNVSQNLFHTFLDKNEIRVVQVIGRTTSHLDFFRKKTEVSTSLSDIKQSDVCVMAISDEAIADVASKLVHYKGLLCHTSGGTHMNRLLPNKRIGVFYPLQTFTKGRMLDFKNIPICIEAAQEKDLGLLQELGNMVSTQVEKVTSEKRNILHLSAVFANNFTNYLYTVSAEVCEENNLNFDLLKPLIFETVKKLEHLSPKEAQTGPAKRGDQKTLHGHLKLLKDNKQRELYTLLSNAIKASYEKEL